MDAPPQHQHCIKAFRARSRNPEHSRFRHPIAGVGRVRSISNGSTSSSSLCAVRQTSPGTMGSLSMATTRAPLFAARTLKIRCCIRRQESLRDASSELLKRVFSNRSRTSSSSRNFVRTIRLLETNSRMTCEPINLRKCDIS